jgi:Ca2+-binding EF-hand superfamily protein
MVDKLPYHLRDEYHEAFGLFDPRGQDYLTVPEYIHIIKTLDPQLDHELVQTHLGDCQISQNTKIDIDLFTSSITKLMA